MGSWGEEEIGNWGGELGSRGKEGGVRDCGDAGGWEGAREVGRGYRVGIGMGRGRGERIG